MGECQVSFLQRSLDIEEHAYTLYLQALAIKGDRKYYLLRGEEHTTIIDLLRRPGLCLIVLLMHFYYSMIFTSS